VPLYQRYGAEDQLTAMYDPVVQLKSGGYLVINPTEALVSIDINSGRSTKEHGIEATAVSTNLEAAREIARQLRLRDMAGLVVIDFIDMEYGSNVRKVEKAMKEALKNDRARIQVGRISGFGLMEMSRQRLRTGVLEATTRTCPHCDGSGLVRTASSAGLSALRLLEDEAAKGKGTIITLFASQEAAVYVLNAKRSDLQEIEHRYGVRIEVIPEGEQEGAKMRVASSGPRPTSLPRFEPIVEPEDDLIDDEAEFDENEDEGENEEAGEPRQARRSRDEDEDEGGRRKRRKRRRGGRGRNRGDRDGDEAEGDGDEAEGAEGTDAEGDDSDAEGDERDDGENEGPAGDESPRKRRRRGRRRRGGRGRDEAGESQGDEAEGEAADGNAADEAGPVEAVEAAAEVTEEAPRKRSRRKKADAPAEDAVVAEPVAAEPEADVEPAPKKRAPRRKKADIEAEAAPEATEAAAEVPAGEGSVADAEPAPKKRAPRRKKADVEAAPEAVEPVAEQVGAAEAPAAATVSAEPAAEGEDDNSAPRRGWWQRTFGE